MPAVRQTTSPDTTRPAASASLIGLVEERPVFDELPVGAAYRVHGESELGPVPGLDPAQGQDPKASSPGSRR